MNTNDILEDLATRYLESARRSARRTGRRVELPDFVADALRRALRRKNGGNRERAAFRSRP
jgi:hypothetical protein